jgi:hypothetical protein
MPSMLASARSSAEDEELALNMAGWNRFKQSLLRAGRDAARPA